MSQQKPRIRVAVVFGGRSGEHAISCATAAAVLRELDRDRYDVIPVGITTAGRWVLLPDQPEQLEGGTAQVDTLVTSNSSVVVPIEGAPRVKLVELESRQTPRELGQVDVVFPLLHGPFGEDGTIQGMFEMADVRYVGSGVLASAVGMDKHFTKIALEAAGLPVGPYTVITDRRWHTDADAALAEAQQLEYPLFVKPARAGSSLGITRVTRAQDLPAAIEEARRHDPKVIVEQGIAGREVECGVLQGHHGAAPRTSPLGEIVMHSQRAEFYDWQTKYFDTEGFTMACPADLPPEQVARVQELAARAFEALECEGLARVDFFVTPDGQPVINEINTMPGFTPYSMFPVMWQAAGMNYSQLLDDLIQLALERPLGLR